MLDRAALESDTSSLEAVSKVVVICTTRKRVVRLSILLTTRLRVVLALKPPLSIFYGTETVSCVN